MTLRILTSIIIFLVLFYSSSSNLFLRKTLHRLSFGFYSKLAVPTLPTENVMSERAFS